MTTTETPTTTPTPTTTMETCVPLVAGNNVAENLKIGPEWEVEIEFMLNEINPNVSTNILQVQNKNQNGQFVFGEHGMKTPACKFI